MILQSQRRASLVTVHHPSSLPDTVVPALVVSLLFSKQYSVLLAYLHGHSARWALLHSIFKPFLRYRLASDEFLLPLCVWERHSFAFVLKAVFTGCQIPGWLIFLPDSKAAPSFWHMSSLTCGCQSRLRSVGHRCLFSLAYL